MKGGGRLLGRRSIKLTSGKHELMPVLNPQDDNDLIHYAIKNSKLSLTNTKSDFDIVCLPYAIRRKDIQHVRDVLGPQGQHIQVYAKIDCIESLHNFEELVKAADGIIINRVELGLELPPEKLMLAQKWMIDRTSQEGKPILI